MEKNILVICSWLELGSNIGIFFIEQAELVKPDYNPILVVFKKTPLTKANIIRKSLIQINERQVNDMMVLEIFYSYKNQLPKKINQYFEKLAITELDKYLKKKKILIKFTHAQSIFDAGIWAYKIFKYNGTPYIITEHNQLTFLNIDNEKSNLVISSLNNAKKKYSSKQ